MALRAWLGSFAASSIIAYAPFALAEGTYYDQYSQAYVSGSAPDFTALKRSVRLDGQCATRDNPTETKADSLYLTLYASPVEQNLYANAFRWGRDTLEKQCEPLKVDSDRQAQIGNCGALQTYMRRTANDDIAVYQVMGHAESACVYHVTQSGDPIVGLWQVRRLLDQGPVFCLYGDQVMFDVRENGHVEVLTVQGTDGTGTLSRSDGQDFEFNENRGINDGMWHSGHLDDADHWSGSVQLNRCSGSLSAIWQ